MARWTIKTLRKHILSLMAEADLRSEQRFRAQETAMAAALAAVKEANEKSEKSFEARMANTNEWRQAMNDKDRLLVARSEFEAAIKSTDAKGAAALEGQQRVIKSLEDKVDLAIDGNQAAQSERRGLGAGWGYAVGVVGLVAALVALLLRHGP